MGIIKAVAELALDLEVHCILGATENMIGAMLISLMMC